MLTPNFQQLPPNWYSRSDPYTILDVSNEIMQQYQAHPVAFGELSRCA